MLAESKLKDYERFEEFFAYASDGMAVLDAKGRFLAINPEGRKILSYSEDELRERPIAQVVAASDQAVIARVVRGFNHRVFPRNLQIRVRTGRGQERTISLSAGGLGGQSEGVIASFRDVTEATMLQRELTATKEFLEKLVNRTGDGIVSARLDGQVILFNSAAESIFGAPAREMLTRTEPPVVRRRRLKWSPVRASGGVLSSSKRLMRRRRARGLVRLGASMLFENNKAAIVLLIDLSQDGAASEIDEQTAQAGEIQGALLMAACRRTVNQPLTTILGFADMAMHQLEETHRARGALDRITEAAERLADRVRELGRLKRIVTRSYGDGAEIVDLEASTRTQLPQSAHAYRDEITQTSFRIAAVAYSGPGDHLMRPLLLLFLFAPQAQAEDAKAFAQRVLDADAMGWTKAHVTLRLTITDKKKRQKTRALEIKGATLKQRAHTLVRFAEPAELAGTAMLMREEPSGATTQLLYQPTYDKIRPIGASSKNERFMGTDFSYSDFEKRDTDEGIYRSGRKWVKRPAVSST